MLGARLCRNGICCSQRAGDHRETTSIKFKCCADNMDAFIDCFMLQRGGAARDIKERPVGRCRPLSPLANSDDIIDALLTVPISGMHMKRFAIFVMVIGGAWIATLISSAQAAPCLMVTLTGTQSGPPVYNGIAGAGTLIRYGDDSDNCSA